MRVRPVELHCLNLCGFRQLTRMVIGVGHPELREALAAAAEKAGATVARGARRSSVRAGDRPSVTYETDEGTQTLQCRLVIGAVAGCPIH